MKLRGGAMPLYVFGVSVFCSSIIIDYLITQTFTISLKLFTLFLHYASSLGWWSFLPNIQSTDIVNPKSYSLEI